MKFRHGSFSPPAQTNHRVRADRAILSRTGVIGLLCGIVAFVPVLGMLANLMVFRHAEFSERALRTQSRTTTVTASRGAIYDRNMNVMAMSVSVENVYLAPRELRDSGADLPAVAQALGEILQSDPETILKKAEDRTLRYQQIAARQSQEITGKIRDYIQESGVSGIHLEPDTQRVYPFASLAAQVIGFTNASNTGAEGLEARYDPVLAGQTGKVTTTKGNYETDMPYSYEDYQLSGEGNSLVLTLDTNIQSYLEKNMQAAIDKYDVQKGAFGIVMAVKTGEILGMATLGSYDPNQYLEIGDPAALQKLESMKRAYLALPEGSQAYQDAVNAYRNSLVEARLSQWRNRCISDGYQPGSTFKTITMAAAIEEHTTTVNDRFYCKGVESFPGRSKPLNCWRHAGHGSQTTFQALQNSCNLALAHIGLRLGGEKFYEYVKAFGLLEPTGVGMSGESAGVFFPEELITNPDANSYTASLIAGSFGQTFEITPMQLIRAVAAVVNGGKLMQPYIVSEVVNAQGDVVDKTEPVVLRQVISEQTSAIMRDMILSVVTDGTAKNAQIAGYAIGGKTATSEKIGEYDENGQQTDDKIVSFVGIAPMDDPEYIVLVALDTPERNGNFYISGGVMGAPTVRGVLEDILPYLNVHKDETQVDASRLEVTMPEVTGLPRKDAQKALQEAGLTWETVGDGETVTGQIPGAGGILPGNAETILYLGEPEPSDLVQVPDFTGMTVSQANQAAANQGLYLLVKGAGEDAPVVIAESQDVAPGTQVARGTTIRVDFLDTSARDE